MALQEETLKRLQDFVNSDKFNNVSPETQNRVKNLLIRQSQPGAESALTESDEPVFGAEQVIPKSPLSPAERFRLRTATPEGRRKILEDRFGTVIGEHGREAVFGPEGLQSIDPKGFRLSDIAGDVAEFLPEAPNIVGQMVGSVAGGAITKHPAGAVAGRTVLGSAGAGIGETIKVGLGKALGTRPDSTVNEEIANVLQEMGTAGMLELGFGAAGKVLSPIKGAVGKSAKFVGNLGRKIIQSTGRVKKMTSDWLEERVKKVGAKEVFTPEKIRTDYGFENLVPRIQSGVVKALANLNDNSKKFFKDSLGVSDDTLEFVQKKGIQPIKEVQKNLNNSYGPISERIRTVLTKNLDDAGKQFDNVISSAPEDQLINSASFISSLKSSLKQAGMIDKDGLIRKNVDITLAPPQVKALLKLHKEVINYPIPNRITKQDYFRYRTILDDSVRGKSADRFVFESNKGLVDGAVKSVNGLKEVNKVYSKAKGLYDDFIPESKTGEKVLGRYSKLTNKQKMELDRLNKEIPFLDDVKALQSAQQIDDMFAKKLKDKKLEAVFLEGLNEKKGASRDFLKKMSDSFLKEDAFYDDYRDWISHLDLQQVNIYMSGAGIKRSLSEALEGKFIEHGVPAIESAKSIVRGIDRVVGTPIRRGARVVDVTGPTLIRKASDEE